MPIKKTPAEQEFDNYKDNYIDDINFGLNYTGQSIDYYTKVKAQNLIEFIKNNIIDVTKIKIMDVGCGHGLIHPFLSKHEDLCVEIHAVDMAASVIDYARKENPTVSYKVHNGKDLPYKANSFDLAYTICVMHHVPPQDWKEFLKEMKRVIKPGGLLVVFEHNPYNPLVKKFVNNCPIDANAVLLQARKVRGLLREIDMDNIRSKYILFTPFDNPFFHWLDQKLNWLPIGGQYFVAARKSH